MGFIYVLKARLHEIMQKLYSTFKKCNLSSIKNVRQILHLGTLDFLLNFCRFMLTLKRTNYQVHSSSLGL